jgi:hypothetical protein
MRINGTSYTHSDIECYIAGIKIEECTAIDFSKKQEKVNNYGTGYLPISRGRGKIECEASITISMNEMVKLRKNAPSKDLLKIPPFNITVSWSADDISIETAVLKDCEITEDKVSSKSGDTVTEIELSLVVSDIIWD